MDVPPLVAIVERVRAHVPRLDDRSPGWRAATALILHEDAAVGPRILFIERAVRAGDRWSGHMALPGGRFDPAVDGDLAATAAREAHEEVGVVLGAPEGRLDDVHGRTAGNAVATFVFAVPDDPPLRPDPTEVQRTVWIPLAHLLSDEAAVRYRAAGAGAFPGLRYEGHTVWGLTLRILGNLADVVGLTLPVP